MTWIARTNGATSGAPVDLREGTLADIPAAQRSNWREVDENLPAWDRNTHQRVRTGIEIVNGGAVVRVTWELFAEPAIWARVRLAELARSEAERRSQADRVTVGSGASARQLVVSDAVLDELVRARALISAGDISVYPVATADGDVVSATGAVVQLCITAVIGRRAAILTARDGIVAAVRAGTVTTSAGVTGHASWPE